MIKQHIVKAHSANDLKVELDMELSMGWLVQSFACNSQTGVWIAVLYREAV